MWVLSGSIGDPRAATLDSLQSAWKMSPHGCVGGAAPSVLPRLYTLSLRQGHTQFGQNCINLVTREDWTLSKGSHDLLPSPPKRECQQSTSPAMMMFFKQTNRTPGDDSTVVQRVVLHKKTVLNNRRKNNLSVSEGSEKTFL